jgi:acyl carrier protein/GNAT superfamily N-acetyltransferase
MDASRIQAEILGILKSLSPQIDVRAIKPGHPLRRQIDLDSMDWLNVIVSIDDRLHVDIPETDYGKLDTLDAIVAYVATRLTTVERETRRAGSLDPAAPARTHSLLDGRRVNVRPIRPGDRPMEADFLRHLSRQSRYKRFMGTVNEFSDEKLRYLTQIDYRNHMALVATTACDGRETEVGVARYVVEPDGSTCEFAIVVDDDWQGSGLAGILMADLMNAARTAKLARMEGIVLGTNHRMLMFAGQLGFTLQRDAEDPHTVRVARNL